MSSTSAPIQILREMLENNECDAALFTDAFLAQVPLSRLRALLAELQARTGPAIDVQAQPHDRYRITTATHHFECKLTLNNDSRVNSLWFNQPHRNTVEFDDVTQQLTSLAGQVSVLVTCDGQTLFEHQADTPLAVGSAFKLAVLGALSRLIEDGTHQWRDVVTLQQKHISMPSGMLHKMPIGSPFTLYSVAALMISISDNTATDLLIDLIGRDAIQALLGTDQLLSTREFFLLKTDSALRQQYLTLADAEKSALLQGHAHQPLEQQATIRQHHPGVEWYVSARKLQQLIEKVRHLDVMSISPGPALPAHWQHIAYKGGSEPGVRNRTAAVRDQNNKQYYAIVTINCDEDSLDSSRFDTLCAELLASLAS